METEEILTTEYDNVLDTPQTKEQNAYFAARRRDEEQATAEPDDENSSIVVDDLKQLISRQHEALAEELDAIRQKYPDEAAKTVSDLGTEFVNLCACGMPTMIAYEKLRAQQVQVPYMGDVGTEFAAEKEYFTKAEVETMSKQQINKNYTKIRSSMEKW